MQKNLQEVPRKLCTLYQQKKCNKFEIFYQQCSYEKVVDKMYNNMTTKYLILV